MVDSKTLEIWLQWLDSSEAKDKVMSEIRLKFEIREVVANDNEAGKNYIFIQVGLNCTGGDDCDEKVPCSPGS